MTDQPRAADPGETGSAPGGSANSGAADGRPGERVVIRDKRRIDPSGGGRHQSAGDAAGSSADGTPDGTDTARDGTAGSGDGAARHGGDPSPGEAARADGRAESADAGATGGRAGAEPATERPQTGSEPDSSPVDEHELAHVLEDKQPTTTPPVVDEPTPPASDQSPAGPGPLGAELEALRAELDERTSDLQRVSAEYANYRKRVDRDRGLVAEQTIGSVLSALLPILDDLDRAREHGDLVGPFGTVAEQLTAAVGKFGLTAFGEKGDLFDPTRHEAVAHLTSAEVSEPTCVDVMRRGYLLGERLLRPALVAVADPE